MPVLVTLSWVIAGILAVDLLIVVGFATIELLARRRVHREIDELDALWHTPAVILDAGNRQRGGAAVDRRHRTVSVVTAARRSRVLGSVSLGTAVVSVATLAVVAAIGGTSAGPGTTSTLDLESTGPSSDLEAPSGSVGGAPGLGTDMDVGETDGNGGPGGVFPTTPGPAGDRGSVPGAIAADPWSSTSIMVDWTAVLDAIEYRIERRQDGLQTWMLIGTTKPGVTTYTDTNLEPETTYLYRVTAITETGSAPPSDVISATTPVAPPLATFLDVVATSSTTIALDWTDVENETSYRIERSIENSGWVTIGTTGMNVTEYADGGLWSDTRYRYRIYAANEGGESPASNTGVTTTDKDTGTVAEPPDGGDGEDPPTDEGRGGGKGNGSSGKDDGPDAGTGTDDGTPSGDIQPDDDPPPEETTS